MSKRKNLTPAEKREMIRKLWHTLSPSDIANRVGCAANTVRTIGYELQLGPNPFASNGVNVPAPPKPNGYKPEQIAWAEANARTYSDPIRARDEAGLILRMHAERRYRPIEREAAE